jgi:anti-sigma B factor antagonist
MDHLEWKSHEVGGATVLVLIGELDRGEVDSVRAQWHAAAAQERHLIIDLTQLCFIDSSGIKELVNAYRAITKARLRFALVNSSPMIQKVLSIVGVDQLLPVFSTFDAALQSIK